jgi:hypothetical protein
VSHHTADCVSIVSIAGARRDVKKTIGLVAELLADVPNSRSLQRAALILSAGIAPPSKRIESFDIEMDGLSSFRPCEFMRWARHVQTSDSGMGLATPRGRCVCVAAAELAE